MKWYKLNVSLNFMSLNVLEKYESDNKYVIEQRFEVVLTTISSSKN